jgi:hypothetical protein
MQGTTIGSLMPPNTKQRSEGVPEIVDVRVAFACRPSQKACISRAGE